MNANAPAFGRPAAAAEAARLRRERHGATDAGNCERLVRYLKAYRKTQEGEAPLIGVATLKNLLPRLVRAEADEALAQAFDRENLSTHGKWIEKANTLRAWAEQCRFESTQEMAVRLVKQRRFVTM